MLLLTYMTKVLKPLVITITRSTTAGALITSSGSRKKIWQIVNNVPGDPGPADPGPEDEPRDDWLHDMTNHAYWLTMLTNETMRLALYKPNPADSLTVETTVTDCDS